MTTKKKAAQHQHILSSGDSQSVSAPLLLWLESLAANNVEICVLYNIAPQYVTKPDHHTWTLGRLLSEPPISPAT